MGAFLGGLIGGSIGGLLSFIPGVQPLLQYLDQTNNAFFPVNLLQPSDYYNMLRTDFISMSDYYNYMAKLGYDKQTAYNYAASQQTQVGLNTLISLDISNRLSLPDVQSNPPDPQTVQWIKDMIDANPVVYNFYKQAAMYLPSITDLNNFYITNAFDDTVAQRYNFDEDLTEDVYRNYGNLGVNRYWTKALWRSTWNYPSFYEAKYMYDYSRAHPTDQNGFTIDDFNNLMKAKNYSSYFSNLYSKILNTPLTISEISRMWEAGTITEDDLTKLLKWEGRSDEQIAYLVPWIKTAYGQTNGRGMKHYTESMITELYQNGLITENDWTQYMQDLKYDDESIKIIKSYIALKEILSQRASLKADIIERYKTNQVTYDDAMTALTNGGFTQTQAQYILDKEKVVKDTPHKKLSVTDLTRLAGAKLITMEEYTSYLADIGYSQSDIQLLQKLYGFTS